MRRGPLADSYPGAAALVVCSLIPYLALTAAVFPLGHVLAGSLGLSLSTFYITISVSTGGYAMGTVLALQFAVHLPARRMLVAYEVIFFLAAVLTAWAPTGAVFIGGFIVLGLCTSLMLIAAVPPLVTSWPPMKMPVTGGIMNLCIFGAVAAGPTVGAIEAAAGTWRPLFWGVAGVAALALLFSLLTFQDAPPVDRSSPWDLVAVGLAVVGCGAAFFGAGELQASGKADVLSLVPLIGGFVALVALVVYEYRLPNPLMPVRAAATTAPVTGIWTALTASAASFGVMELVLETLQKTTTPTRAALLFVPEFVAAAVVAVVFGVLFRTRYTPVLALGGLLAIAAGTGIVLAVMPAPGVLIAAATGVLGLGVAASVSPGLFMAGFSLRSAQLQRVFAMIELMRGVTAFLVAPILVYLAGFLGSSASAGTEDALWICVGIAGVGFVGGVLLYVTGKGWLQAPDLERWQEEGEQAWDSPPLLGRLRRPEQVPAGTD